MFNEKRDEARKMLFQKYDRTLLTKKEAAYELLVSTRTLDRMRKEYDLINVDRRGRIAFHIDEVARLICEVM